MIKLLKDWAVTHSSYLRHGLIDIGVASKMAQIPRIGPWIYQHVITWILAND